MALVRLVHQLEHLQIKTIPLQQKEQLWRCSQLMMIQPP